ncbi:ribosome silencing factor [Estrella lausannensis]|uniref:Ribosomal silencing factor RsfS n=1 Tax=Estrella lausannensis TaxID=483423 RepID=A0A0H5DS09_9BACT|nr:ribosome silencing factor [Estrella lausannensis]CRX38509.1 Iojap family protein [Estrella lausannensis]
MDSIEFLNLIAQTVYDKKGANILGLDIRGLSSLTDFFIIAEGGVDRHVKAIANTVREEALKVGIHPIMVEGEESGDWCVLDFGEVIVHLFVPQQRLKYALEELWSEGKIVDLKIESLPKVS